ncbi:DUF1376 domain-containing protein [Rhodobacteraceae bacterium R_SAG2]|nr:DUF1376 domain-containing protein [Rhodobacteraceae bacterium R_SAG2]
MSDFDPKRARAKRPCPLWVDAFQRDTQHLQADEVGAYMLILMAMWTRPTCDLPEDPARIARVARVSKRLWDSRVGPVIMDFLMVQDGAVISERLRKEAAYVERQVTLQSNRKSGEKSAKGMKTKEATQSTDTTTDDPSQQPNNPTEEETKASSSKEAGAYQRYLKAHPKPVESDAGFALFSALVAEGIDPAQIIASAAAYAETVKGWSGAAKVQQSDNFLDPARGKWRQHVPKPKAVPASEDDQLLFWAARINSNAFVAESSVKPDFARKLIERGLVTPEKLKERGIAA